MKVFSKMPFAVEFDGVVINGTNTSTILGAQNITDVPNDRFETLRPIIEESDAFKAGYIQFAEKSNANVLTTEETDISPVDPAAGGAVTEDK